MGIFRLKFCGLSDEPEYPAQIIGALLVGGWAVYAQRLEIGGVVAFVSGIGG